MALTHGGKFLHVLDPPSATATPGASRTRYQIQTKVPRDEPRHKSGSCGWRQFTMTQILRSMGRAGPSNKVVRGIAPESVRAHIRGCGMKDSQVTRIRRDAAVGSIIEFMVPHLTRAEAHSDRLMRELRVRAKHRKEGQWAADADKYKRGRISWRGGVHHPGIVTIGCFSGTLRSYTRQWLAGRQ